MGAAITIFVILIITAIYLMSNRGRCNNGISDFEIIVKQKRSVGSKAIPLLWFHKDKVTKKWKTEDVSIYGFYYSHSKKTVYGIRHWQGWEYVGYTQIPLSQLRINDKFEYQKMGIVTDKYQVSYKEGGPTFMVVGWVFIPSKGICAVCWDSDNIKFKTVKSDLLLDTEDPQRYYQ